MLSLALPFDTKAVADAKGAGHRPVAAFLEGLLPEGNFRRHLAASLGVTAIDTLALLQAVGAECAGAVQFVREGETPSDGTIRELADDEVNRLVADLPTYHLPERTAPQASLAGIQDKVLLVARPDGSWGWPEGGAASSHIIKPEPLGGAAVPHLIQTEHWAMSVAGAAGLSAAQTTVNPSASVPLSSLPAMTVPTTGRGCTRKISARRSDWTRTQNMKVQPNVNVSVPGCADLRPWRPTVRSIPRRSASIFCRR